MRTLGLNLNSYAVYIDKLVEYGECSSWDRYIREYNAVVTFDQTTELVEKCREAGATLVCYKYDEVCMSMFGHIASQQEVNNFVSFVFKGALRYRFSDSTALALLVTYYHAWRSFYESNTK